MKEGAQLPQLETLGPHHPMGGHMCSRWHNFPNHAPTAWPVLRTAMEEGPQFFPACHPISWFDWVALKSLIMEKGVEIPWPGILVTLRRPAVEKWVQLLRPGILEIDWP